MKMNRRRFLATTLAAGAGTLVLDRVPGLAAEPAVNPTDPFQLRPLGKTGLKVSLIGMGTGMHGFNHSSNLTRLGQAKADTLLHYAYDRGIRYFDCADMYGTNEYVGRVLKTLPRDKVVVCTKMWVRSPDAGDTAAIIDRFRKELQTDYIDFVLLHCMTSDKWCDTYKRQMDVMAELKDKGALRAHGASFHSLDALKACVDSPWVQTVHARLNAYGASMDAKDPALVMPVVKKLHEQGKGVIAMKLIGEGSFGKDPSKIDKSIEYVLGSGAVDSMIVGFDGDPKQIDDFATRVEKVLKAQAAAKPA